MKMFNLWDIEGVKIRDKALQPYIYIKPILVLYLHLSNL